MNYPGTRIATSILLCIASFGAFASDRNLPVSIAPLDTSLANDPFTVTGTVRSPAGEPLAGVPIRLWEQERPEALWERVSIIVPPSVSTRPPSRGRRNLRYGHA